MKSLRKVFSSSSSISEECVNSMITKRVYEAGIKNHLVVVYEKVGIFSE